MFSNVTMAEMRRQKKNLPKMVGSKREIQLNFWNKVSKFWVEVLLISLSQVCSKTITLGPFIHDVFFNFNKDPLPDLIKKKGSYNFDPPPPPSSSPRRFLIASILLGILNIGLLLSCSSCLTEKMKIMDF